MSQTELGSGTGKGMLAFLQNLIDKGRAGKGAVIPLMTAVRQVLSKVDGAVWEATDVRKLDVEDYMARFANLTSGTYTTESLTSYKARLNRALRWYSAFLSNPGWTPPTAKSATTASTKKKVVNDTKTATIRNAVIVDQDDAQDDRQGNDFTPTLNVGNHPNREERANMIAYPFPLLSGQVASLYLPVKLSKNDAQRLAAFVNSISIDDFEGGDM